MQEINYQFSINFIPDISLPSFLTTYPVPTGSPSGLDSCQQSLKGLEVTLYGVGTKRSVSSNSPLDEIIRFRAARILNLRCHHQVRWDWTRSPYPEALTRLRNMAEPIDKLGSRNARNLRQTVGLVMYCETRKLTSRRCENDQSRALQASLFESGVWIRVYM